MLTDRDRRVLKEIERGLSRDDPQLVRRLRWPAAGASDSALRRAAPTAALAVALVAMGVCAVLLLPVATLVSGMLAVVVLGYVGITRRAAGTGHPTVHR